MLSLIGWLNSLTGSAVVIFGCLFGLLVIYQAKKKSVKFLFYTGLLIIFVSLLYLGQFVDFLTILFTGSNLNPPQIYAILCYMWIAPAVIVGFYIGAELIIPERKKIIVIIFSILGIIFELFLWLDTANSFTFNLPDPPGENIIDVNFNLIHPTFILILVFLAAVVVFLFSGFLYKGLKSTGIIRKKFLYLSFGFIIFTLTGALDSLSSPGNMLFVVRLGMISCSWFWYYGLKEEHIKPEKTYLKEKESIDESKLSLIEILAVPQPTKISEKEVTFYREQIVCLVCKGKVEGFNFICFNCKAMYCEKCARTLIDSENACWVCNSPMDKSRLSTPFKKEEKMEKVEKLKKTK